MLILLYILLVLSALVWAAVGFAAFTFLRDPHGARTPGSALVAVLCGIITTTLLGMLLWFLTADISIAH